MEVYISGITLFLVCAVAASIRSVGPIVAMGIALPFEATALLTVGGVGLNVFDAFFLSVIGFYCVQLLFVERQKVIYVRGMKIPFWICVHALAITMIMPIIFSGDFSVAPVSGRGDGQLVGRGFGLTVVPFEPTLSNISQMFYLFLQMGMFCFFLNAARKYGVKVLFKVLVVAGIVNLGMVGLEFIGVKSLQEWFFTADFRNLTDAKVMGIDRLVGGFREAARQGQFSAMVFGMFFAYFISTGRILYFFAAAIFMVVAVMSLSSTGIVCVLAAMSFMALHGLKSSFTAVTVSSAKRSGIILAIIIIGPILAWYAIGPIGRYMVESSIYELVVNKGSSASGMERKAILDIGNNVAQQTFYLGSGIGSTRSNGLLGLWISNVGIFGLGLMLLFIYRIFRPANSFGQHHATSEDIPVIVARTSFFVILAASLVSLTMPSLGQLFPITAAFAFSAAERAFSARSSNYSRVPKFRLVRGVSRGTI